MRRAVVLVVILAVAVGMLPASAGAAPADPFGSLDALDVTAGGLVLRGWAVDPDTVAPIDVHIYVDGRIANHGRANLPSPDVVASTGWGGHHRYAISVLVPPGPHEYCAYGINTGPGANSLLACHVFDHPVNPFGALEYASLNHQTGRVNVHGWAIDPDTDAPIAVHFWADGMPAGDLNSARRRSDLTATGFTDGHGFANAIPVPQNAQTLCAYGVNVGPGVNTLLGCQPIDRSGNPVGAVQSGTTGCVSGSHDVPVDVWAVDPDTGDPVDVAVYTGVAGSAPHFETNLLADLPGPDPGFRAFFPQFGLDHWLKVCSHFSRYGYYAINAPGTPGTNRLIGGDPRFLAPVG